MPEPYVLSPGDVAKVISHPPAGSTWRVEVDGIDVYGKAGTNPGRIVAEGDHYYDGDRAKIQNLNGKSYFVKNPTTNSLDASVEVFRTDQSPEVDFISRFLGADVRDEDGNKFKPYPYTSSKEAAAQESKTIFETGDATVASGATEVLDDYTNTSGFKQIIEQVGVSTETNYDPGSQINLNYDVDGDGSIELSFTYNLSQMPVNFDPGLPLPDGHKVIVGFQNNSGSSTDAFTHIMMRRVR
jgi:hypothetical protein